MLKFSSSALIVATLLSAPALAGPPVAPNLQTFTVDDLKAALADANAQTPPRPYTGGSAPSYGPGGPNSSYMQGPHTRVYITKRSWLDAGVEVLPGDRKFTDYAYPPELGYPSFARENKNAPIDRGPLNPPSDLGGYPRTFPLY